MKLKLVFAALLLLICSTGYAAEKIKMSPEDAFDHKVIEFQKQEVVYSNTMNDKQQELFKKLQALEPDITGKDEDKRKQAVEEARKISDEISGILEELTVHEVESATFNIQIAQRRLEKAKANLAAFQKKKKAGAVSAKP